MAMKLWLVTLSALALAAGAIQCTDELSATENSAGEDLSWKEYVQNVYGEKSAATTLNRYQINLLYKNTPTQVVVRDWKHNTPLDALNGSWGDTIFRRSSIVSYAHNEWAEVNRYSTYFLNSYKKRDVQWEEGYSRGFPGRSRNNETKVAYGCWFNLAKGSGIYANVGRTLVVNEKYHSTVMQHLNLTSKACIQSETSGGKCYDRYFCTAALALGYDSIQVTSRSELVICNGKCATEPLLYACPAIPLRNGYNANGVCNCSDRSHILNCGDDPTSVPNLHFNFPHSAQTKPARRHKLCAARHAPISSLLAFNLTLAFTSGVLDDESVAKRTEAFITSLAIPEGLLLVDVGKEPSAQGDSSVPLIRTPSRQRRRLRATPMGPHPHTSPPPPPGSTEAGDSSTRSDQDNQGADDTHRAEYFHHHGHHDHDHQHHPGAENTETLVQAQWRLRLQQARYSAVATGPRTAPRLWAGGDIALLSASIPSLYRATIVAVGDTKVGLIVYGAAAGDSQESAADSEHVREYVDEAVCLRNAGADMVVLMTSSGAPAEVLVRGLKGYADLIIAAGGVESSSCEGRWHAGSNHVPVVQIRDAASIGLVQVQRLWDRRPSFRSRVVSL